MWRQNFWQVRFKGMPLEGFRAVVGLHRGYGKLQLVPHHVAGWVLVFIPRASGPGQGWYLEAEKRGKVRVFKRIESAVHVVEQLPFAFGLYVNWRKQLSPKVLAEVLEERYPEEA